MASELTHMDKTPHNFTASLKLTGGVVHKWSSGTGSSLVVCKHTHDVRVSAVAVKLTV